MWQTKDDLKDELEAYRQRGNKAWTTLQKIPTNFVDYPVYKKRQAKKRILETEIETVKTIMEYIKEAIDYEM
jgi:hypothetical protein